MLTKTATHSMWQFRLGFKSVITHGFVLIQQVL